MSKQKLGAILLCLAAVIILSITAVKYRKSDQKAITIVPLPQSTIIEAGNFRLQSTTRILVDSASESTAELLAETIRKSTGYEIPIKRSTVAANNKSAIILNAAGADSAFGPEGYELSVKPFEVIIRAGTAAGLFYGTQSLLQLLPPEIFSKTQLPARDLQIPCVQIRDKPRFRWRGFMLDVSRHFFTPSEIKRVLDLMALHKLNVFHWHLTDDQGWRIEIKKYPRLTEVGAWRTSIGFNLQPKASTAYDTHGRYGGYYTQADVRDIVAYAKARFITIVPEIEMPGHASAALASYPQFSCSGGPYTTDMAQAVSAGVFCAGQEATYDFLTGVLAEVMDLFPGEFIHVGGDEVPTMNWRKCPRCQSRMAQEGLRNENELRSYFIRRIEQFVDAHRKRMIGWSEIQNVGLAPATAIMDWIGGGVEAAQSEHDVVMTPVDYCYFDFYQSKDRSNEPLAAGAYLPLQKVYSFEPIPIGLGLDAQGHILGAQANLWTEYIASLAQVEYMTFPRLSALAEIVWSPNNSRNWQDFSRRLMVHERRLDQLGVKYRR